MLAKISILKIIIFSLGLFEIIPLVVAPAAVEPLEERLSLNVIRLLYPKDQHLCGGVLISAEYVLTAATCVEGFEEGLPLSELVLVSGSGEDMVTAHAITFFIHNRYNRDNQENNIAFLRTDNRFVLPGDEVGAFNLMTSNLTENCYVFDLDTKKKDSGKTNAIVTARKVQSKRQNACSLHTMNTICMGGVNNHLVLCEEDYGTGLVCDEKLLGIFLGPGDACDGMPGIYLDLRQYSDWILTSSNFSTRSARFLRSQSIKMKPVNGLMLGSVAFALYGKIKS